MSYGRIMQEQTVSNVKEYKIQGRKTTLERGYKENIDADALTVIFSLKTQAFLSLPFKENNV